jgi:tetratricopeptide (TPR) repeat protein
MRYDEPLNLTIMKLVGKAAKSQGLFMAAIYELEMAREIKRNDPYILRNLARLYVEIKDLKRASERFGDLKTVLPHDEEAARGLQDYAALNTIQGAKWAESDSFIDKVKDLDEALKLHDEQKKVRSEDDVTRAIGIYTDKMEKNPQQVANYTELASLYSRKKQFDKAEEMLKKGLGVLPDNYELLSNLGDVKIQKAAAELAEAKRQYQVNPSEESKGAVQAKARDLSNTRIAEYRRRVETHPADLILRYRYGEALYRAKMYDEAIEQIQKAVGDLRTRQSAYNLLGMCFRKKGLLDYATEQFQKALKDTSVINEKAKNIIYNLATTYEELEKYAEAEREYKRIYEVDIGFKDIAEKIQRIYKKVREKGVKEPNRLPQTEGTGES